MRRVGLLEPQPGYYLRQMIVAGGLLAAGLVLLAAVNDFRVQLLNAAFQAFVFGQISFLVHDAGHGQVFRARWKNRLLGLLGANLIVGGSFGAWGLSHSRHHRNPNHPELDPDLCVPLLAFTAEQAQDKGRVGRWIVKYQVFWFPFLILFEGLAKRQAALAFLLRAKPASLGTEVPLLAAHYAWFLGLPIYFLGVEHGLVFIAVHQALYGIYMILVFAPNHIGMPILAADCGLSFLERQAFTARNVRTLPLFDFLLGGLNYQIEHHLFPRMARNKLRATQRIVEPFCRAHNIPYYRTGILRSFGESVQHLHQVSHALRARG